MVDVDSVTEADVLDYYRHLYPDKTEDDLEEEFLKDIDTMEGKKALYLNIRAYKRYVRAVRKEARRKRREEREKKKARQTKLEAEKRKKDGTAESTTPHTTLHTPPHYTPIDKGVVKDFYNKHREMNMGERIHLKNELIKQHNYNPTEFNNELDKLDNPEEAAAFDSLGMKEPIVGIPKTAKKDKPPKPDEDEKKKEEKKEVKKKGAGRLELPGTTSKAKKKGAGAGAGVYLF